MFFFLNGGNAAVICGVVAKLGDWIYVIGLKLPALYICVNLIVKPL